MKTNTNSKETILWSAVVVLVIAVVATYVSLTFKIQDTEKRLFESLHEQRIEIEELKQR